MSDDALDPLSPGRPAGPAAGRLREDTRLAALLHVAAPLLPGAGA